MRGFPERQTPEAGRRGRSGRSAGWGMWEGGSGVGATEEPRGGAAMGVFPAGGSNGYESVTRSGGGREVVYGAAC